ncbi:MAG: 4Fe-4S binding protein [Chloroflexota bacterium]
MAEVIAKENRRLTWWRRARQLTRALFLLLFLYLLVQTRQSAGGLPTDLFFRLDPLAGVSAMLASRSWLPALALGGVTLVLTLALGRFWCGWLCPMGTVLDWLPLRRRFRNRLTPPSRWQITRYVLLFAVLLSALAGSLTLIFLDPITLLFRTITVTLPLLSSLVTATESLLYRVEFLQTPLEQFDQWLRASFLPAEPRFFLPNLALILLFLGVVALNLFQPRFWCRHLCPLGTLLGLASRVPWLRQRVDQAKCTGCQRCAAKCPLEAMKVEPKPSASPTLCTLCLDCLGKCSKGAITFRGEWGLAPGYDPSRRRFLASAGIAVAGAALLHSVPPLIEKRSGLVLPPGTSEERLISQCIRCGECLKVCPTGGLQPGYSAKGLWTPMLVSRLGYCDYSCQACGRVCPTQAIPELTLQEKRKKVLGIAYIDRERCIPWNEGRECIVCEEMCPVPQKAIRFQGGQGRGRGRNSNVLLPHVVADLCIGCGICEHQCPVGGESAIRIYPPEVAGILGGL